MFGVMKSLLKEKAPLAKTVKLADLHVGCVVGFGFMPQKNISGHRLPVTELNSYIFEDDTFLAYRLEYEDTDINLIVADGEDMAGTYLALSQRIDESLFSSLFSDLLPAGWFGMREGDAIEIPQRTLGVPQGWLCKRYILAMVTHGNILEGDFRMRKPADRLYLSRPFEYALFVDENNSHALEAEKYEDGTIAVFATIYRPVTDIGEMTRATRPALPNQSAAPAEEKTEEKEDDFFGFLAAAEAEKPESLPLELIKTTPVHSKFGRIQPAHTEHNAFQPELLACDTRLAARIIDEAERNQLLLSELIRKVIDLPARIQDEILIPFALEDAEYAELGRRYKLPPSDHEAVKRQILEELRQFIGM